MLLELIDERQQELKRLSDVQNYPAGRVAHTINIKKVTGLLSNLKAIWEQQPNQFKNEFLRIILDRIMITDHGDKIRATIIWKTGLQQEIEIMRRRVPNLRLNKWAAEEIQILRESYATAKWEELARLLPKRDYWSIIIRASKLGLRRAKGTKPRGKPYTTEEDNLIRRVAKQELEVEAVSRMLGRTPVAIVYRMRELGILRTKFSGWRDEAITWSVVDSSKGNQDQDL